MVVEVIKQEKVKEYEKGRKRKKNETNKISVESLVAKEGSKLQITKLQNGPQFWWLFSLW